MPSARWLHHLKKSRTTLDSPTFPVALVRRQRNKADETAVCNSLHAEKNMICVFATEPLRRLSVQRWRWSYETRRSFSSFMKKPRTCEGHSSHKLSGTYIHISHISVADNCERAKNSCRSMAAPMARRPDAILLFVPWRTFCVNDQPSLESCDDPSGVNKPRICCVTRATRREEAGAVLELLTFSLWNSATVQTRLGSNPLARMKYADGSTTCLKYCVLFAKASFESWSICRTRISCDLNPCLRSVASSAFRTFVFWQRVLLSRSARRNRHVDGPAWFRKKLSIFDSLLLKNVLSVF